MGIKQPKEARRYKRQKAKKLPGELLNALSLEPISCEPVDVSKEGLGIHSKDWLLPQVDVILAVGDQKIPMEIVWGIQRAGQRNLPLHLRDTDADAYYRYGLKTVDESFDLAEIFRQEGCLK